MPSYNNTTKTTSKSVFSSVWAEVKKPASIRFPLILLYKVISTFQVLSLMLEIPLNYFHHTEGKWKIIGISRAFTFLNKFDYQSDDSVTGIVFVLCWVLTFLSYILIGIIAISTKVQHAKTKKVSKALNHLMVVYQFVFFLPINTFMLGVMKTSSEYKIRLLGSTNDTLIFVLAMLVFVMNFIIGLFNLRCYSPLYAPKTFSKRNAYLALLDLGFKIVLSIYVTFAPSSIPIKWVAIAIMLAYTMISIYVFHTQLPFFQVKLLVAYCYILGAKIAFALSVFIVAIFDEFRTLPVPDLPVAAFIFCLPACIIGQTHRMEKTLTNAIMCGEKKYESECDVFIRLIALRYIFKKGASVSIKLSKVESTNWNMQLNGLLIRHNDACSEAACGCRTFLELDENFKGIGTKREKYRDLKITLMREVYEKGAEKVGNSELILLNLAQFYLLYLENYLKSYLVLQAFEKNANRSFETEVLIEYLKKRIQERMELKLSGNAQQGLIDESNSLNVTALVQNDVLFIQLKKLVQDQVQKQLKFWDLLDNFELNTRAIETCCEETDVVRNKIERLWDQLSRINHKCSTHYFLYGLYQTLINNTTKRGERYLNDYSRMVGVSVQEKEGITNDNLYDSQTVVIRISMRRDKIGMIEESSGELESVFGYQGSDIIDTNVATLMSSFFKERHHAFVTNHFDKGTENALNRTKRLFGYHREGHIFPIFLYVSIYPNIENNLSYMGIIRPRKVYNNYILLKSDGTVDSYSPEIAEYLGLESRKKYNVTEICPDFEKINNAFNYITRNKYANLKDDIVEYKGDYSTKKSNEYQVKISGSDSGNKEPLQGSKREFGSIITDREDAPNIMNATIETKDEVTMVRSKEKNIGMAKAPNKFKGAVAAPRRLRRLNTEDIEEYKKVYDQMAISGSVLTFVPQKEKTGDNMKNFLCTVSDEIFDFSILRIITLGRNDENIEVEKETERNVRTGQLNKDKDSERDILDKKEMLLDIMQDDMGISALPNYDEMLLFKNPFDDVQGGQLIEKRGSELVVRSTNNKDVIFRTIKTDTQENSTSQIAIQDMKERRGFRKGFSVTSQIKGSDYDNSNHEKHDGDLHDSRDFIQEMLHNDLDRIGANATSVSMKGGIISKFEALLYKKEEGKISNKFKAYFMIIAACFAMAIANTLITDSSLSQGSQKVQKVLSVGERINVMLNLNFNCRILYLYVNNYITADRHLADQNIANYPQYALDNIKVNARNLLKVNTAVMNDIYDLHASSQPNFFSSLVPLKYPTAVMEAHNVKSLDSFEAVDTVALAALEVSSVDLASLSTMTDDIQYILLNSMNQLYLEMTNGFKVYEEDLEVALSGTRSATWGIAISVLVIYVMFLIILFRDLTNTHQDKIRFWNSLIKLDTIKSVAHKRFLQIFKENFESSWNNQLLKKALVDSKKQELRESKINKAKENQATGFKKLKSYKFRNRSYFIVFPFIIVLGIILAFFIANEITVSAEMDNKRMYLQEIKKAESYYQLNQLTLNGIYEFISEKNTTTLQEKPIQKAIENNLASLSELATFISNFKVRPSFDPKIFIQMNFCDIYQDEAQKSACTRAAQGINTQGLSSVLTFSKETMEGAMDYSKHVPLTDTNIETAFRRNSLVTLETEMKYISEGFEMLVSSLAESERQEQSNFWGTQVIILIAFIIIMVSLNYLMVWKGFKRLDGQKFDNMKILRVIPSAMILESKMLKTYLLKSFKDDLSSITNKL